MTIEEQLAILQAYANHIPIQVRKHGTSDWTTFCPVYSYSYGNYEFDFVHNEYRIKPTKWRAEMNGEYFYITSEMDVDVEAETNTEIDELRWVSGNYFKTREEAALNCKYILDALKIFHDNKKD